jgi:6-phosphogluconolactonase (cycloisomerase 2 family)
MRKRIFMLCLALVLGCSSSSRSSNARVFPAGVAPGPGFPSAVVLAVSSRGTSESLSLLSIDQVSGELGLLPGSPIDVGTPVGDFETLAVDAFNRRIYLGSDSNGLISVSSVAGDGSLSPIAGSPFLSERGSPTVLVLNPNRTAIYVGYAGDNVVSQLSVDPATGAIGAALGPPVTINGVHVETMRLLGDLLFVFCRNTNNILCLRVESNGTLTPLGLNEPLQGRADYADFIGQRMYVSTGGNFFYGFDVDPATGALTALPNSPWTFPGLSRYELIRADPSGQFIAVGAEEPASIGLLKVEANGSLSLVNIVSQTNLVGGPEGIFWEPNGRFLYVADHIGLGLFVYELVNGQLAPAAVPRYRLPGGQIDLVVSPMSVNPP